jgi:hypothetical protein
VTSFVLLVAVNASLRLKLECLEAVALELIAERDRAVVELGRLQQLSLLAEGDAA